MRWVWAKQLRLGLVLKGKLMVWICCPDWEVFSVARIAWIQPAQHWLLWSILFWKALVFLDLLMKTNPSKLRSSLFLAVIPVPVLENWERETWTRRSVIPSAAGGFISCLLCEQWPRPWLFVSFYAIDVHKFTNQPVECYKGQVAQQILRSPYVNAEECGIWCPHFQVFRHLGKT